MIEKIKPIFGLDSKLGTIPREWLRDIEPKIIRKGQCWLWQGAHNQDGEPVMALLNPISGKRNTRLVKRIVAAMFYLLKKHYDVWHECGILSCLNPAHLHISSAHSSQEDRKYMVKRKRFHIDEYEKRGR